MLRRREPTYIVDGIGITESQHAWWCARTSTLRYHATFPYAKQLANRMEKALKENPAWKKVSTS